MSESNAVQYEAVSKESGEAFPITLVEFGDTSVINPTVRVETTVGVIMFPHSPSEVELQNDGFYVREVGTHMATDGVHNTDEEGVVTDAVVDEEVTATEENVDSEVVATEEGASV